MIYNSTRVSKGGIPLLRSPHLHLHRWVTKGEEKRGARAENWGSLATRGRSSVREEVERSEKKSWWISCLNKWGGGRLFDQWACLSSPHPPVLWLDRVFTTQTKRRCNFLNLNTSCRMWISCVEGQLIMNWALYTLPVFKLFQHTFVKKQA